MANQKSNLVPVGMLLIILSFFSSQIDRLAKSADSGSILKSLLFFATDGVRLCFFIGATLLIIGIIRNKRMRKQ